MEAYYIHESSYIDFPCTIGKGTKIWHFSHIQKGAVIGEACTIGQNVNIGPGVIIGKGVKIQNNVSIYQRVELQDYVFCGPSVVFTNCPFPRSEYPQNPKSYKSTLIKKGATLGANSTIVCGIVIGSYAFIAAGSVVSRDVPDYALVMGAPARHRGWVCECGNKLNKDLSCLACHKKYIMKDGLLKDPTNNLEEANGI